MFASTSDRAVILSDWLQRHQPCLFGRVAAKLNLIRYCFLDEDDLVADEEVRDKIQAARLAWTKDAFDGRASAFIILFISKRLVSAVPDATMLRFALRLCSLYLREFDVHPDSILHERVCLEKPGDERMTWEWLAGVNYFSAQADRRWWADHRIPAGVGFSINSVGHMAKAGRIGQEMQSLAEETGMGAPAFGGGTIRSLSEALKYAMLTINSASDTVSGKATTLLELRDDGELTPCPIALPRQLAGKNHCAYAGWYHTDYTLPSDYFRPDIERAHDVEQRVLDFTYLFLEDVDNAAHDAMGVGHRIRADSENESGLSEAKRNRMIPTEVEIAKNPILAMALRPSS